MLFCLKIVIHDVKTSVFSIPKAPLDYDFYVLMTIISLNHFLIPLPVGSMEYPFCPLLSPSLYRVFITLHIKFSFL